MAAKIDKKRFDALYTRYVRMFDEATPTDKMCVGGKLVSFCCSNVNVDKYGAVYVRSVIGKYLGIKFTNHLVAADALNKHIKARG